MRVSRSQWGWAFLGILAWGSLSLVFAQNKVREFGRPNPPNAVPAGAAKVPTGEARVSHPAVMRLAFSPDGRVLASASADQTIGLWDLKTGELITDLKGDGTQDLRFSPDGWMLGAADRQRGYRLWEVTSAVLLLEGEVRRPTDGVLRYRFSPELDRIAIGSDLGQVHLMETATANLLHGVGKFPPIRVFQNARVGAVALSPDANLLAIASGLVQSSRLPPPNQVILWDLSENKKLRELGSPILEDGPARSDSFQRLEFSSDGSTLAAMHSRRGLFLWDATQGFHWPSVLMSQGDPFALSGDGKTLVRLKPSSPSHVELVEVATAGVYQTVEFEKPISALALSRDGRFLAAGSKNSHEVFIREIPHPALKKSPNADDLTLAVEWLAQKSAQQGRKGMAILIAGGDRSVSLLVPLLKLNQNKRDEEIQRLIRQLNDDDFFTRENATKELRALGESAVPALKAELKKNPPLEVATRIQSLLKSSNRAVKRLSGESLQRIRAIDVLEKIETGKAQELLEQLAKGPASTLEAHEANMSLKRIQSAKESR